MADPGTRRSGTMVSGLAAGSSGTRACRSNRVTSMKYLIVNGDDFGASAGINRGIVEAHCRGILTSTSLLVDSPWSGDAAERARDLPGLSIGLHIDLPERSTNRSLPDGVAAELERQFFRFKELVGRPPTHIDSHHNVHRAAELRFSQSAAAGISDRWTGASITQYRLLQLSKSSPSEAVNALAVMPIIVLSPFNVVNFPQGGGHFWVYMQYAQGLLRLGCEVYWLENFRTSGDEQVDAALLHTFFARMHRYGLDGKVLLYESGHSGGDAAPLEYIGMSPAEAEAVFDKADLLLNFHYAADASVLARFKRTALVDIDPGLLQFWISRSQLTVGAHDYYFTTGETVGTPGAFFPDCDLNWLRIRPPVCLEQWPYAYNSDAGTFTTISNWDSDDWIVDGDEAYENTKRRAFLEFIDLPRLTAQRLDLALYLRTDRDFEDRAALEDSGWRVRS